MDERQATQEFMVRNALVEYTGCTLTPDRIDEIVSTLTREMTDGPCAWCVQSQEPKR